MSRYIDHQAKGIRAEKLDNLVKRKREEIDAIEKKIREIIEVRAMLNIDGIPLHAIDILIENFRKSKENN